MDLKGKTILITRAAHQADELKSLIEQAGGTAEVFSTIDILPPSSWDACDRAIESLYMFDGAVFTSTNGVEWFTRRLRERGHQPEDLRAKTICAVGEKTRQTLEQLGLTVTTMPEKFTAVDLATKLQQEDLHGKSFLFPRGNLANDILPEMLKRLGATVEAVTVYRTEKPSHENTNGMRTKLLNGAIDVVTFTSPSTVHNFIALFSLDDTRRFLQKCIFAAIGPRTAAALEDAGLIPRIVAQRSTAHNLVESIAQHFSTIRNTEE